MKYLLYMLESKQGWRSGESARLPSLWPDRFDSRTWRHMWVEFVVGSRPCSEGFSPFPKTNSPNSNLIGFDARMHGKTSS